MSILPSVCEDAIERAWPVWQLDSTPRSMRSSIVIDGQPLNQILRAIHDQIEYLRVKVEDTGPSYAARSQALRSPLTSTRRARGNAPNKIRIDKIASPVALGQALPRKLIPNTSSTYQNNESVTITNSTAVPVSEETNLAKPLDTKDAISSDQIIDSVIQNSPETDGLSDSVKHIVKRNDSKPKSQSEEPSELNNTSKPKQSSSKSLLSPDPQTGSQSRQLSSHGDSKLQDKHTADISTVYSEEVVAAAPTADPNSLNRPSNSGTSQNGPSNSEQAARVELKDDAAMVDLIQNMAERLAYLEDTVDELEAREGDMLDRVATMIQSNQQETEARINEAVKIALEKQKEEILNSLEKPIAVVARQMKVENIAQIVTSADIKNNPLIAKSSSGTTESKSETKNRPHVAMVYSADEPVSVYREEDESSRSPLPSSPGSLKAVSRSQAKTFKAQPSHSSPVSKAKAVALSADVASPPTQETLNELEKTENVQIGGDVRESRNDSATVDKPTPAHNPNPPNKEVKSPQSEAQISKPISQFSTPANINEVAKISQSSIHERENPNMSSNQPTLNTKSPQLVEISRSDLPSIPVASAAESHSIASPILPSEQVLASTVAPSEHTQKFPFAGASQFPLPAKGNFHKQISMARQPSMTGDAHGIDEVVMRRLLDLERLIPNLQRKLLTLEKDLSTQQENDHRSISDSVSAIEKDLTQRMDDISQKIAGCVRQSKDLTSGTNIMQGRVTACETELRHLSSMLSVHDGYINALNSFKSSATGDIKDTIDKTSLLEHNIEDMSMKLEDVQIVALSARDSAKSSADDLGTKLGHLHTLILKTQLDLKLEAERHGDSHDAGSLANSTEAGSIARLEEITADMSKHNNAQIAALGESIRALSEKHEEKISSLFRWMVKNNRRLADFEDKIINDAPKQTTEGNTNIGRLKCLVCDQPVQQVAEAETVFGGPSLNATFPPRHLAPPSALKPRADLASAPQTTRLMTGMLGRPGSSLLADSATATSESSMVSDTLHDYSDGRTYMVMNEDGTFVESNDPRVALETRERNSLLNYSQDKERFTTAMVNSLRNVTQDDQSEAAGSMGSSIAFIGDGELQMNELTTVTSAPLSDRSAGSIRAEDKIKLFKNLESRLMIDSTSSLPALKKKIRSAKGATSNRAAPQGKLLPIGRLP